jgi:hypothetical protein
LPYTYIGELTNIENAIVSSNNLIRVDTNTVLKITDAFLLADLKESPINNNLSIVVNSLSGIILLFLSLPLWPVAFVFSLFQEPPKLMQKLTLRGNRLETGERGIFKRKNFTAWYWTTAIPILRNLPLLFPVIAGHLRIVGTLPLTPAQADRRTEDWELLSDKMPAGLIGPTTLQIPANAPIEEKLMSDAFYVQQHNFHKDLKYILLAFKTIFSHRAWMRFDTLDEHRN